MQLSLLEYLPELNQKVYLDVFARKWVDRRTNRASLWILKGQPVPNTLKVRCNGKAINRFPEGTIFKLDIKLVKAARQKPYFCAVRNRDVLRAIEFFEYNLKLQSFQASCEEAAYLNEHMENDSRISSGRRAMQ